MGGTELLIGAGIAAAGMLTNLFAGQQGASSAGTFDFGTPSLPEELATPEMSAADMEAQAKAEQEELDRLARQNVLTSDAGLEDDATLGSATLGTTNTPFGGKYVLFK